MDIAVSFPEIFGYFLTFVAGLFIGSFLNVVSDRTSKDEGFVKGRSHCDECKHPLAAKDLIPLFSYLFLKGKCRYCKKPLSAYYPISEVLTGLVFVLAAFQSRIFVDGSYFNIALFFYYSIVLSILVILVLTDLKYRLIPNKVVVPGIIFVALFIIGLSGYILLDMRSQMLADEFGKYLFEAGFWHQQLFRTVRSLSVTFASAAGIFLFFWFLIFITKGKGMGGGDLKLGVLIGLFNGFPLNVIAIFLGFLSGAIYSLSLIAVKKKGMKDTIPFGPFLILGSIVAFILGSELLTWYLSLF